MVLKTPLVCLYAMRRTRTPAAVRSRAARDDGLDPIGRVASGRNACEARWPGAFIETDHEGEIGKSIRLEFKVSERRIRVFGSVTVDTTAGRTALPLPTGISVIFFEPERDIEDELSEIIEQIWNRHRPWLPLSFEAPK